MRRLPAEWEGQDAIMLTWPHENTDWASCFAEAEATFYHIAHTVLAHNNLAVLVPGTRKMQVHKKIQELNPGAGYQSAVIDCDSNDTWARDHGPICILENYNARDKAKIIVDFTFNGWGNKYPAERDNAITAHLYNQAAFKVSNIEHESFVLEGGAIESDGYGTILTTETCLLNPNRNPKFNKNKIESELKRILGAQHILWLKHGYLAGDDTDSHIDTLARLAPNNTIFYVKCDDESDEHYDALTKMEQELQQFRNRADKPYSLIPLPWPSAKFDNDGNRLPATYANFLITNDAVLVPTYHDKNDQRALEAVKKGFPNHRVYGIDCSVLIQQHGSLHCITMQIPHGFLNPSMFAAT